MIENLPPTWAQDVRDVTRWLRIDCSVTKDGSEILILRRILGWDASALPDWVRSREEGSLRVTIAEADGGFRGSAVSALRRLQPRLDSFLDEEPAAGHWGLRLPCVTYEAWCTEKAYTEARAAWLAVPRDLLAELSNAGLLPRHVKTADAVGGAGYAGSTILHVPQVRPYCPDLHQLVLPGGPNGWGRLTIVSTVFDGTVELGIAHATLNLEPMRQLDPTERLAYLTVHCPPKSLAELNQKPDDANAQFIAKLPSNATVGAGADLELLLVPENGPPCRMKWGLIKTIGFTLKAFTGPHTKPAISNHMVRLAKEPWVERVPQFGHTIHADVRHVPPGNPTKVFEILADAGHTLLICDPYATKDHVAKVLGKATQCKLLTTQAKYDAMGKEWCQTNGVEVRTISDDVGGVHDRFILGNERGYILGTSLNGLGKRHSFIVEADNKMRWVLREVFENLWQDAVLPSGDK